jgi:hypothetical protein
MKFGEWIAVIFVTTGLSIFISAGTGFFINNFAVVDSPFTGAPPIGGSYVYQETSKEGGEQLEGTEYILRDTQEGIELYFVKEEKGKITYHVYNETLNPVCVYSEMMYEKNITSSIFFSVPIYPFDDRQIGVIHLAPEGEPFYVFNWHVTSNPNLCGELQV